MEIAAKVSYFILNSPVRSTKKQMECLNSARVFCSSPFSRWITSRSSSSKLFIGGLSYDTNETILKDAFKEHGEIIEGYGFVHFATENAARNALKEMDGIGW